MKQKLNDYDSAWKDIIEVLFKDFLDFFYPEISKDIDWSKGYEFLNQELKKIFKDHKINKKYIDELVKVFLNDGSEKWIYIHIEVQGYKEDSFNERLFIYNYRIFDKFHHEVITLAILTDEDNDYRPDKYAVNRWGFELNMKIPIVKITDYANKTGELEKSNNPMAIVVLTVLDSFKAKDDAVKFNIKINLIRKLYKKGFDKDRINSVFKFIDWILNLPDQYELKVRDEIYKLEGETMPYVTSIERIAKKEGIKEGKKEGIKEGKIEDAINLFKEGISLDIISKCIGLKKNELEKLINKKQK